MEATGRYEQALVQAAQGKGVPVVTAQPIAVRRKQVIGMLTMEKNRLQVMPAFLGADIRRSIRGLTRQVAKLDEAIQTLSQEVSAWRR